MRQAIRSLSFILVSPQSQHHSRRDARRGLCLRLQCGRIETGAVLRVYPIEAVATNVLGTENTLNAAIASRVKNVIVVGPTMMRPNLGEEVDTFGFYFLLWNKYPSALISGSCFGVSFRASRIAAGENR
jgi:hypothetical protein